ncbi:MAG: sulfite exporter TauE/SafE family protein [Anaerolineae bacterium]
MRTVSSTTMYRSRLSLLIGAAVLLSLLAALAQPIIAAAHPLGNFTTNRYSRLELAPDRVRVKYILDMAEIPTFQELPKVDGSGDGQLSDAEREAYAARKIEELTRGLTVSVGGAPVALQPASHELSFPDGQGGLKTLRLSVWLEAPISGAGEIAYRDDNYPDRLGWSEIVVAAGGGVRVEQTTAHTDDVSHELLAYPEDMLSSPLSMRDARVSYTLTGATDGSAAPAVATAGLPRAGDAFADLVSQRELSVSVILLSLLAAFGLGALHAMSPGHGKTMVGAYLVGSRGTWRHAIFLGLTVTATHTAGVFALGLVTLYAQRFILPEQLYPWLSVASGLLVVAIGASLVVTRLRGAMRPATAAAHAHGHDHPHAHHHDHDHEHPNERHHDHEHPHAHDHHHHDHGHEHDHRHRGSIWGRVTGWLTHSHGPDGHTHSHVPGDDGRPVTWRSLLALGISGGLLPCPSALVVLLSAISLHRVGFGLLLIVAFSLGLASILVAIGLALVYAGRFVSQRRVGGPLVRILPAVSAAIITLVGLAITLQALSQVGVWHGPTVLAMLNL